MIELIGQPLLEAAAQTFIGAIAGYTFDKLKNGIYKGNTFDGAFDLWQRGIHCKKPHKHRCGGEIGIATCR